jgi:uncharacterized LabA/DUF88 family protein
MQTSRLPTDGKKVNGHDVDALAKTLALIRAQEKVCMFIDNSNLFHALKSMELGSRRLDYIKLRDLLGDGRSITVRFYYSTPPTITEDDRRKQEKRSKFYDFLECNLGYQMIELPLRERQVVEGGQVQYLPVEKGLDCEIVYDMAILSRSGHYDTFLLVTGDEDYARTVRRIRRDTGIQVEVAFFSGAGCSTVLTKEASKFIDLNQMKDEIFREYRNTQFQELAAV